MLVGYRIENAKPPRASFARRNFRRRGGSEDRDRPQPRSASPRVRLDPGIVAHPGERLAGSQEVAGSSPADSTVRFVDSSWRCNFCPCTHLVRRPDCRSGEGSSILLWGAGGPKCLSEWDDSSMGEHCFRTAGIGVRLPVAPRSLLRPRQRGACLVCRRRRVQFSRAARR